MVIPAPFAFDSVELIKEVRLTEWMRETNVVQLSVRRYFSGVGCIDPGGMRREDMRWRTPFDAKMSGSMRVDLSEG